MYTFLTCYSAILVAATLHVHNIIKVVNIGVCVVIIDGPGDDIEGATGEPGRHQLSHQFPPAQLLLSR